MDFLYLFRVLLKRKWIIISAALLAAGLAFYLTRNQIKYYKSSAQISTGYAIKEQIQVDREFDPYAADTKFNNTIVDFTSPSVLSLLSYQLMLHDLTSPTPFRRLTERDRNSPAYKNVNLEEAKKTFQHSLETMTPLTSYDPQQRKLIEFLKLYGYEYKNLGRTLNIYRRERTDYLQIDFLSENPELSAFVVNNVFEQFLRYYKAIRTTTSRESIDTLRSIRDRKKLELDFKNAQLAKYGYVEEGVTTSTMDVAGELRTKMQEEASKKTTKEYELKRVQQKLANLGTTSSSNTPLFNYDDLLAAQKAASEARVESENDPGNQDKKDKYNRLNTAYQNLRRDYNNSTKDPSSVKPTESKQDLEDKAADLQFDIQGYQKSIDSYNAQINQLEGEVSNLGSKAQIVETLKKERDLANKEYIEAQTRYNDAMDISGSSVNNFRQTVVGQPAIEPEPSKRMIVIALAGAAAFFTTMLIIIFLTYLDSSIKTPTIFSKSVNLKLISLVNYMDLKNKKLEDIVANKHQTETVSDRNKFNAFRESIRKLRYEIESTGKKVFLFTSTKKGQGKTTLIQALAYSMSISKKKILIIDTNFCNPDLTLQLDAQPVLEKILPFKGEETVLSQVKRLSKDIGVGTVYIIGAEGGDYTPSEILPRENILHHLQELTAEYDYIFLEGPPLNDFSDSKELTHYVDGVIAVFAASHIIKQIDKQSISFFKELNGKFCGSILNMVDLTNVNAT